MKSSGGGGTLAYEVKGVEGPWVVFSHSLGCSRHMWRRQVDALAGSYRVVAYDLPGHGESNADSKPGSLDQYADDVLSILDELDIGRASFIGISVGGMIGQTLAIKAPERVSSLVLANTSFHMPPGARPVWEERIRLAKSKGVASIAGPSLERWFPESFRTAHPEVLEALAIEFGKTSVAGYVSCCEAIMNLDTRDRLNRITCPTLIVGGTEDPGAPPEMLEQMRERIPHAELLVINGAGHLSNIDQSELFTSAIQGFLGRNESSKS